MDVIPAIDLKGGKCVRLYQGDYKQETVFSEDPVSVALKWQACGAGRLHIIDLDGAAGGKVYNFEIIKAIAGAVKMQIQVGGGIRTENTVKTLLDIGIKRTILGTVAIEEPDLVQALCRKHGDTIIIGIDARDGFVATRGWLQGTNVKAIDLVKKMAGIGVKRILYTDIKRDGTLTEPAFDSIADMVSNGGLPVIAAGGIASVDHLRKLAKLGVEGAIVGKSIYTGNIDLAEAIRIIDRR
jgi:phosphoribosylformimino-5-aminoimidazole carboxamide ribotide isomerase